MGAISDVTSVYEKLNSSETRTIPVAIIGGGSWGTAIGAWLARNGHDVRLWDIDETVIDDINATRTNSRFLPDVELPSNIRAFRNLESAMEGCLMAVLVVPSRVFETALGQVRDNLHIMDTSVPPTMVWGTKGFSSQTGGLLSESAKDILGEQAVTAVISGPSFASEVVRGLPAGFDLGSRAADRIEDIADVFRNETTLVYTTDDIVGVQVGGATKNVIAIAAGISDGMGLGINARCMLISRGLAEMGRLNSALGGKAETMMGLSGMGDLVLTCSGDLSRNRRLGLALGKGMKLDEIVAQIGQEVEGIQSTREAYSIGKKLDVFMPMTDRVYRILNEGLAPQQAARELMAIGPSLK
ncbi:MAG: NAD(P)-dependent glycerol-3-phosphate dehydrogenase [Acidiferrobacterales bacterium]|nr:NAD(P)-dependent glycerol-3-phosphate dehydrogenase [Acidiferrobacterales bacterium]